MRAVCLLALVPALTGCAFFKSLAGRDYVDLENAQVESMSIDIRKERKTLCPRERVQMAVFLKAKLEDETAFVEYETWNGDESRNDKLSFEAFNFHANLGTFDQEGWFQPSADLLKTLEREFVIHTVLKSDPDKFTMKMSYKPDYRCLVDSGVIAQSGTSGDAGEQGPSGENARDGDQETGGDHGGHGAPGGPGGSGTPGAKGQTIEVYATMVSTKFYDKLVAVRIGGALDDFVLFAPEQQFVVFARGGDGGDGGEGGPGGDGGDGGRGNPGGDGGNGGDGAAGGPGADGGDGGNILLVVDERYPEIGNILRLDVTGGRGGRGGQAGRGGYAGSSGSGAGQGAQSGNQGEQGANGESGSDGRNGSDGIIKRTLGDVSVEFDIPGLRQLGESDEAAPAEEEGEGDEAP